MEAGWRLRPQPKESHPAALHLNQTFFASLHEDDIVDDDDDNDGNDTTSDDNDDDGDDSNDDGRQ